MLDLRDSLLLFNFYHTKPIEMIAGDYVTASSLWFQSFNNPATARHITPTARTGSVSIVPGRPVRDIIMLAIPRISATTNSADFPLFFFAIFYPSISDLLLGVGATS